jgi:large subunit ribosomal protein L18
MAIVTQQEARTRRHIRVRKKVTGTSARPRLCVYRSLRYIYAQVIDDSAGNTIVSASSVDPEVRTQINGKTKTESADIIGNIVAKRALDKGIKKVVFDRGGYKYHGRVKVLADAARKTGLEF